MKKLTPGMKANLEMKQKRLKVIRAIYNELRDDRNRPAAYAQRVARRYADWYVK